MTFAAAIRSAVSFLLLGAPTLAQVPLAPTPPMGWNSWDSFGTGVTETEVKANADYMAKNLAAHGWQYVVVDIQWSEANPKSHGYRPDTELVMDGSGRLIFAPIAFLPPRMERLQDRSPTSAAQSGRSSDLVQRWRVFTLW